MFKFRHTDGYFGALVNVVLLQAYRRSMTHPTYAWMFYNWYSNSWWKGANLSNCTFEIRKSFLEYSLVFDHYPRIRNKTMTNIANMVRDPYCIGGT